jgi:hypothetical protein
MKPRNLALKSIKSKMRSLVNVEVSTTSDYSEEEDLCADSGSDNSAKERQREREEKEQ